MNISATISVSSITLILCSALLTSPARGAAARDSEALAVPAPATPLSTSEPTDPLDPKEHDHEKESSDLAKGAMPNQGEVLEACVRDSYEALSFREIFVTPAGPKGLEYTNKARRLESRQVRITGFMVRHVNQDPNVFMVTEHPVSTMEHEFGTADDVPPNVVHALLEPKAGFGSAWQPYTVTVYGRLELGGRHEKDTRVSYARIHVDHVTVGAKWQRLDVRLSLDRRGIHLSRHRHAHAD